MRVALGHHVSVKHATDAAVPFDTWQHCRKASAMIATMFISVPIVRALSGFAAKVNGIALVRSMRTKPFSLPMCVGARVVIAQTTGNGDGPLFDLSA